MHVNQNSGTINLDGRYYTETESDTLFTKLVKVLYLGQLN